MYIRKPFKTQEYNSQATSGATTGITPSGSNVWERNTETILIFNTDTSEILHFMAYNEGTDATIDLGETIPVQPNSHVEIHIGTGSLCVGVRRFTAFNTSSSATKYRVTEVMSTLE